MISGNGILDIVEFTKYCIDAMGDNKDPKGNLMKALQKFDKKKVGYLNDSQIMCVNLLGKLNPFLRKISISKFK